MKRAEKPTQCEIETKWNEVNQQKTIINGNIEAHCVECTA